MAALRIVLIAWYVATGFQVSAYAEQRVQQACPGHMTAWERYPGFVVPFEVAVWPVGLVFSLFPNGPVCDRFDPS